MRVSLGMFLTMLLALGAGFIFGGLQGLLIVAILAAFLNFAA